MVVKEHYLNVKMVLNKLGYNEHNCAICVDFKMVNVLSGQQVGYTKYPYFPCYWDIQATTQHWVKKDCPACEDLVVGDKNFITEPQGNRDRIVSSTLHKLGLMKQFVKALDKDGICFNYIVKKFPSLSMGKLQAGIFRGPQFRKLIQDQAFTSQMTALESAAWCSYVSVV